MKKIFRTVAALAVVMFAGCTTDLNDEVVAPGITGGTTVTVGIADTKTYLGELVDGARKVYWHNGDQIAINGNASTAITLNEDKTSAVFEFGPELTHPYSVLYPASMYKDPQTITLPAVQAGATNNFAKDTAPMASYQAAEGTVQMHHLAGVIRLQVKLPAESTHTTHPLNKVETKGNAGEQMSGDFAIDYEAVTLTATSTAEADKVVTTSAIKDLSAEESDDVFIVVPAREYPQGITVRLIDKAGHYMDIASKAMTIAAGEIKAMPVVEFVPTGTLVGVEISSAEELIAFANAYNANEYADVDPLVVTLTQDIVFDEATNAAWTPIGGKFDYGDHYFNGYFDGAGFSIKSWNSTRPLFAYTNSDGVIENLTIDASCTLTANFADESEYYGAFVGYHRGLLLNCHVNANLTATGNWTKEPHVGALVGRVVVGTVENCTVSGDVTITNTLVTNAQNSYYGGAVARVSNAAGVIKGVSVSGNISHSAGSTYIGEGSSNVSDANVYYGGVVGILAGTCTDCHLTDATKKFFYGNYVYNDGPTNQVENHYRSQSVGAIAGQVEEDATVSNCTNRAEVVFNQYNGSRNGSNDVSRYLYGGGIVGYTKGSISNCTMYASLTNRSSCLQQYIGGVVGNVQATATISNCANEGASIAAGTTSLGYYQARNNNIGGVIGVTFSTALSQLSNKANLNCSRMNSNADATLSMGGIIGNISATGTIDGNNQIVNYGTVLSTQGSNIKYNALGGIAGVSSASLTEVKNLGQVQFTNGALAYKNVYVGGILGLSTKNTTIDSATNEGVVYFYDNNSTAYRSYNVCVGGIVGSDCSATDAGGAVCSVTIKDSTNSGVVSGYTKTRSNGRSLAMGGIVGALTNSASKVSNCTVTGVIGNRTDNNNRVGSGETVRVIRTSGGCSFAGGIAGFVEGTADSKIVIEQCTFNNKVGNATYSYNKDYAHSSNRGEVGCLVGLAKYADIKNCDCIVTLWQQNTTDIGGLVCQLINSNLEGCTLSDSTLGNSGGGTAGGFVANSIASTIHNNTLANVALNFNTGTASEAVMVGLADSATSITDNKISGTFQGAEITLSSLMCGPGGGDDNLVAGTPTISGTTLYTE